MKCGDTLVLRGEGVSGAGVEWGARRGVGGVKFKAGLQVSHRGAGEKVPRDIVRKFIVGAGTRIESCVIYDIGYRPSGQSWPRGAVASMYRNS